ncbi:MAG: hypothetical protein H6581_11650 [Bacteroidia bacterium]|nr:hypothetical protein [Bacteroidia bacterium]
MKTIYSKIKFPVITFFAVYSVIWGFLETGDYFGVISLQGRGLKAHFGFILISLIFTILVSILDKAKKEKSKTQILHLDLLEQLKDITKEINGIFSEENPYKLKLIQWRLKTELNKLKNIRAGNWILESLSTYSYLRYIFGSVLMTLEMGDEYITLSNLEFWSKDNVGDNEFLDYNLRAVKDGVVIKRIIIINPQILRSKGRNKEKNELKLLVKDFMSKKDQNSEFSKMSLFFYLSPNSVEDLKEPVPFALIKNRDRTIFLKILPNLNKQNGRKPSVQISFANDDRESGYSSLLSRYLTIEKDRNNLFSLKDFYDRLVPEEIN